VRHIPLEGNLNLRDLGGYTSALGGTVRSGCLFRSDDLHSLTDADLDTVGRSAYPGGLDPTLPLIEIVWWVNKELLWHAAEIWYVRDLYAALRGGIATA
jgi:hypothetical protein